MGKVALDPVETPRFKLPKAAISAQMGDLPSTSFPVHPATLGPPTHSVGVSR
jgi:hypothetical protein